MIAQLDSYSIRLRPWLALRRLISYALFEGRPLTTRGRWINSFLFFQFRIAQILPLLRRVEKPIYIVGTGRSGTTILGKLLHMHPQVGFLNEPKAMWHAIFSKEDLIGSYTQEEAFYRLDASAATQVVRKRAHRLFGYYLFLTGAHRVVDKYPEMIYRISFLRAIFPDARFIFLVRNGLDTLRSIATWSRSHREQKGSSAHDWWGINNRKWHLLLQQIVAKDELLHPYLNEIATFTRQEDMAAVEWIATIREGLRTLRADSTNFLTVYYEKLTRTPDSVLPNLLDFCELPYDRVLLEYARKVLTYLPSKVSITLHPVIQPVFQQTMEMIGYRTHEHVG